MEYKTKVEDKTKKGKYTKSSKRKPTKGKVDVESPEIPQYGSTM